MEWWLRETVVVHLQRAPAAQHGPSSASLLFTVCVFACATSQDVEDFYSSGSYDQEVTGTINNAILFANAMTPANNSAWVSRSARKLHET